MSSETWTSALRTITVAATAMIEALLWIAGAGAAMAVCAAGCTRRGRNAVAVAVVLGAAASTLHYWRTDRTGHDFHAVCTGIAYARSGQPELAHAYDPPRFPLPITYPSIAVTAIAPLCRWPDIYWLPWLAAAAAAMLLFRPLFGRVDWWLAIALGAAAFRSLTWVLTTGNVAVFEFLLVTAGLAAMVGRRRLLAGVLFGLGGFLRIAPLGFAALAFTALGARAAAAIVVLAVASAAALHVLFWTGAPAAAAAYWAALGTGFWGLFEHEAMVGTFQHPSLASFAWLVERGAGAPPGTAAVLTIAAYVVLGLAFLAAWRAGRGASLWSGVTLLLLVSPRLKPYTLILAVPAAYAALAGHPPGWQVAGLVLLCAMPFAAYAAVLSPTGAPGVVGYAQLWALLALYAALLLKPAPSEQSQQSQEDLPR